MKYSQSEDATAIPVVGGTAGEGIEELYSFHNNLHFTVLTVPIPFIRTMDSGSPGAWFSCFVKHLHSQSRSSILIQLTFITGLLVRSYNK